MAEINQLFLIGKNFDVCSVLKDDEISNIDAIRVVIGNRDKMILKH